MVKTPPGWGKGFSPFPVGGPREDEPLFHPTQSTYANRVDLSGVAAGVQQRILDVDLPVGQPYTIQIAEVQGAFSAPVGLTGGPTAVQLTVSSAAGYGAAENIQVVVGRNQSTSINHNGPVQILAAPLNATTAGQLGPIIAVWITIRPAVPISWPIDSTIEAVPAAFATVAAHQGFPARYRPFLSLQADGGVDVQTIDRGGLVVAQWLGLTPQLLSQTFRRTPMDPQTRLQIRQGPGPAANTISIIYTDN